MASGAIATSNRIYRSWTQGENSKHHLLNGQTGNVAITDVIQATVVTSSLCDAEVGAKLCFLVDDTKQQQWLEAICDRSARFIVKENQAGYWAMTGRKYVNKYMGMDTVIRVFSIFLFYSVYCIWFVKKIDVCQIT